MNNALKQAKPAGAPEPTLPRVIPIKEITRSAQGQGGTAGAPVEYVEALYAKRVEIGEVEIGGLVPFADTTPPSSMIKPLLDGQLPWVLKLSEKLPRLRILKSEAQAKGAGVYALTLWVENTGYLPFPTAMGRKNQHVPPAVVVTYPYFCVFHNDGFVSRIGLLDHLAGTHKIPLDAAATICPDGVGSCVFPSY